MKIDNKTIERLTPRKVKLSKDLNRSSKTYLFLMFELWDRLYRESYPPILFRDLYDEAPWVRHNHLPYGLRDKFSDAELAEFRNLFHWKTELPADCFLSVDEARAFGFSKQVDWNGHNIRDSRFREIVDDFFKEKRISGWDKSGMEFEAYLGCGPSSHEEKILQKLADKGVLWPNLSPKQVMDEDGNLVDREMWVTKEDIKLAKKEEQKNALKVPGRKRGRPCKTEELKVEEPKVEEPKVEELKRKRGRPCKTEELKAEEPKVEEPKVEEPKRKRGRPRKTEESKVEKLKVEEPKRKRGRPHKIEEPKAEELKVEDPKVGELKRKRGRPRKTE